MSSSLAAIVGGAGGSLVLLGILVGILLYCMSHCKPVSNNNSDTASPDPSALAAVELKLRGGSPRRFRMDEIEQATNHFHESNLIGHGSFGLVYKGLLREGTIAGLVVIKRRTGFPTQEFVDEVSSLSGIWHRNLVTLLGYCQDCGYQMLVYEYLPNGSMYNHLYVTKKGTTTTTTKLDFKQRLSIALGAAKGLCYLHSQQPPLIHGNCNTANVLVDENFIAKVADAGIVKLLERIEDGGPSTSSRVNVFRDPEVGKTGMLSIMSDVYSFGIFLLELITGQDVSKNESFGSERSIFQWVEAHLGKEDLVDHRLIGGFTEDGMKHLLSLTLRCVSFPGRGRPKMENVVLELDTILEKEIMFTTVIGEGTSITLGSQLFTSSS